MAYRIVVCMDVDGDTVDEAYGRVYDWLKGLPKDMDWESSDEWFTPEGDPIPPSDVQQARMRVFKQRNPEDT